MVLPSGNLNSPLFAPTPTRNAYQQLGGMNPARLQGQGQFQQQPNPFEAIAQQQQPLDLRYLPPFGKEQIDVLRGKFMDRLGMGIPFGQGQEQSQPLGYGMFQEF